MESLRLLSTGYLFWAGLRNGPGQSVTTRLLGQRWVCGDTVDAASAVYDPTKVTRRGAVPGPIQATLFGRNAVQILEGVEHLTRKQWFLDTQSHSSIRLLREEFSRQWRELLGQPGPLNVFEASSRCLMRAAMSWVGCSPSSSMTEADLRRDMVSMFDAIGSGGPRHWAGRRARKRAEAWATEQIVQARQQGGTGESLLATLARFENGRGEPLTPHAAGVELLNLVRPIARSSGRSTRRLTVDGATAADADRPVPHPGTVESGMRIVME